MLYDPKGASSNNCVAGNGNVGIGLTNPSSTLTVSGTMEVLGYSEDQLYCYANDTWVPVSQYDQNSCA